MSYPLPPAAAHTEREGPLKNVDDDQGDVVLLVH
jgi:hypothetical protein